MIDPNNWQPSPGISLEPNAWTAIRTVRDNTAIAAGPGAGKTELLAQRANFLFTTGACPAPQRVVAISFKVDAARNLRERVAVRCPPRMSRRFDSYTFHAFARTIITRHREVVTDAVPANFTVGPGRTATQLAYSDLLPLAIRVLDLDERAVPILRQSYGFAFFDEFQDCTPQQFELIKRVFGGSDTVTTAVGDSKQRIMGWAGALNNALSDYGSTFAASELPIYQNHRSLKRLRRVQNSVIKAMDPSAALPDAELASTAAGELASDGQVHVLSFATAALEAVGLADLIMRDIRAGTPPSEVAILVAKQPRLVCEELVRVLTAGGVPVRDEQDAQDVFGEPVGELILDLTRLLALGQAPDEFARVGEFMTRHCVDERQADRRRRRFERFLETSRAAIRSGDLDLSRPEMLKSTLYGFLRICERQFLSRLSIEYTDDIALTAAANAAIDVINDTIAQSETPQVAMARLSQDDAVRLLTVHKSKGLEFDHVYFVAIEEETFFGRPDEERSTFFVGISRARSRLVLTHVRQRRLLSPAPYSWKNNRNGHSEYLGYAGPEHSDPK